MSAFSRLSELGSRGATNTFFPSLEIIHKRPCCEQLHVGSTPKHAAHDKARSSTRGREARVQAGRDLWGCPLPQVLANLMSWSHPAHNKVCGLPWMTGSRFLLLSLCFEHPG